MKEHLVWFMYTLLETDDKVQCTGFNSKLTGYPFTNSEMTWREYQDDINQLYAAGFLFDFNGAKDQAFYWKVM